MFLGCIQKMVSTALRSLHSSYKVRFGVALVGRAGAGKSVVRRLLAEGSTWLRGEELSQVSNVAIGADLHIVHRYLSFAISLL